MGTAQQPAGGGRIASLDMLRLLAVAAVWFSHSQAVAPPSIRPLVHAATQWCLPGLGVAVFFVISGFVITRILLNEQRHGLPLRGFYIRRAARIFPPYFLLLLVTAAAQQWQPELWGQLHWSHWAYVFNWYCEPRMAWGHAWTLAIEEQFYLAWPVLLAASGRALGWHLMVWGIIPFSLASGHLVGNPERDTPPFVVLLAVGAVLAFHEPWARSATARAWAVGLILAGLPFYCWTFMGWREPVSMTFAFRAALCAGIVLLALSVLEPLSRRFPRLLRPGWLTTLGVMTYGLYLYHLLAFDLAVRWVSDGWYRLPLAYAGAFAMAAVSYAALECPLIKWAGARFGGAARASTHRQDDVLVVAA